MKQPLREIVRGCSFFAKGLDIFGSSDIVIGVMKNIFTQVSTNGGKNTAGKNLSSHNASLAQWSERVSLKDFVAGSNPAWGATFFNSNFLFGQDNRLAISVRSSRTLTANFASVAQLVTRKSETEYSQDIHIRPEGECGEERVCSFHPSVGKTAEHPSSKNGRSQVRVLNEAPISPKSTIRAWNTSRNKRVAVTFRQHGKSMLELIIPTGCKSQRVVGGSNPSFGTIYGWSQRNRLENTCKYPNEMAETV